MDTNGQTQDASSTPAKGQRNVQALLILGRFVCVCVCVCGGISTGGNTCSTGRTTDKAAEGLEVGGCVCVCVCVVLVLCGCVGGGGGEGGEGGPAAGAGGGGEGVTEAHDALPDFVAVGVGDLLCVCVCVCVCVLLSE